MSVSLLHLNQMLYYVLCMSYHSNTEAVLLACLSSGWATTTVRLLGPKVGNSIKFLSQGHSDVLPHRESTKVSHLSIISPVLYQLSYAAAMSFSDVSKKKKVTFYTIFFLKFLFLNFLIQKIKHPQLIISDGKALQYSICSFRFLKFRLGIVCLLTYVEMPKRKKKISGFMVLYNC